MLAREKPSGAVQSGINLIGHEENFLLVAKPPEKPKKIPRRHDIPSPSLDRFDQDGPDLTLG